MSPMRIATLVVATAATLLAVFAVTVDATLHQRTLPFGIITLLTGMATAAWVGFLTAHCRDILLHRLNELGEAVDLCGDQCHNEGRLAAMRDLAKPPSPRPQGSDQQRLRAVNQD